MEKKSLNGQKGITRRDFIKTTAMGGAVLTGSSLSGLISQASAAKKDHILIGRCNPSTGPLAAFGEPSPWIDDRAVAQINKDGGIFIEELGKKLPNLPPDLSLTIK